MDIIKSKINQASALLKEMDIDMWLLFERETIIQADPTHAMVVGIDVTWESFFIYTKAGDAIALVGNFDEDEFKRSGRFTEVHSYVQGVGADAKKLISRFDPNKIALNYSPNDVASDGLTHGMYLLLCSYLKDTPYCDRIISAEDFVTKLRARKLPDEVRRLSKSAVLANHAWSRVLERVRIGMTEKEVSQVVEEEIRWAGGVPSFATIVNAGAKTNPGHGHPTDARLEPGDLLHVDFGVLHDGYCSDLQRLIYFKRPDESSAPHELQEAFDTVYDIISRTGEACIPGKAGHEIDSLAREILRDNGYPEYQHALGHQLGRSVHDGGGILGPKWERYGNRPDIPLELHNVFTLELGIELPGIGYVGLEEDVVIESSGARFLCDRQKQLTVR